MSHDTSDYNLKAIRDQLLGTFTPETFRRLFRYTDNPALRPVLTEFSPGDGLATMIDKTIDYCETRGLLDALLREVQPADVPAAGSAGSSLTQAQLLMEQGSHEEAIRLLQRMYHIFPHNEQIERLLLEALYAKGVHSYVADYNLTEARRAFKEVLSIDPLYEDANRLESEVLVQLQRPGAVVIGDVSVAGRDIRMRRKAIPSVRVITGAVIGSAAGLATSLLFLQGVPIWVVVISAILGGVLGGLAGGLLSLLRE